MTQVRGNEQLMRMQRLPVEPERLRREFPDLTDGDLEAYVQVTRRILGEPPPTRGEVTRRALDGGRLAREKAARGQALTAEESVLLRYLQAMEKMQRKRSVSR